MDDNTIDNTIDEIYYSDDDTINVSKAFLGSLFIICIMICCVTCIYKYARCQEKKEKEKGTCINVQNKFSQEV